MLSERCLVKLSPGFKCTFEGKIKTLGYKNLEGFLVKYIYISNESH